MCGITGIIIANQPSEAIRTSEGLLCIDRMTDRIAHRGPDGKGRWSNDNGNVFLGHRRLSVIDLSNAAAQPMHLNNRYTIVHNGEIYNHVELRKTLQLTGYAFRTQSDTEVILAAYDCWKEKCLQQFDGMFAFAIWDEKEQQLFAARDRFGEKPFFYYEDAEHFLFASEMKALWAAGIEKKTDEKMLLNYLTLGHVQNSMEKEQTFFENIFSLPPAHFLKMSRLGFKLKTGKYWNINREIRINIPAAEALEKFKELFMNSVTKRLRSDVPVGSSLSGGLDSSSIVYYFNDLRNKRSDPGVAGPLKTFSAVFPGFKKDESLFIRSVVERFGIENHQVTPTADGLISNFEKLCYHQEEPFQTSGVYAQYKVFEMGRQYGVKVLLDGQGADEILAGYPRYIHWYLQEVLSRHKVGATQKERIALRRNHQVFRWNIRNVVAAFLPAHAAIQLEKDEFHKSFHHPDIGRDFLKSVEGREWEGIHKPIVTKLNDILYFNTLEMGLEELLRFADRNSMAHGMETRLPFLDHRLVEFVFSLPAQFKIHQGRTKWLLRQAMNKKLPDEIVWRTDKTGFEPPQQEWMRNPALRDYIHEAKKKLVNAKILCSSALNKKIEPLPAYAENNYDWRYLCAAHII